jgi:dipeptide/tripeptide permease
MRRYPPGFLSLSASVACERFGFFLLASLLLLYLNERLGFTTAQATDVLGCFIAATYVSPLLAGAMTDGRFGIVRAAALGYLVAAAGYALLAAESRPTLYAGLDAGCARGWRGEVGPAVHSPPVCLPLSRSCTTEA